MLVWIWAIVLLQKRMVLADLPWQPHQRIVPLVGGTVAEALNYSKEMLEITTKENPNVTIPVLDFMGIPSGIDVLKVLETGMPPVINTAIAHKEPGIGMIGAGLTNPPTNVFNEALKALVAKIN